MIAFRERRWRDSRYAIVTFHDATVRSITSVGRKLQEVGLDLDTFPLPILLDTAQFEHSTFRSWQVSPSTTVLIDPDGKVRAIGEAEEVLQILEKELSKE